MRYNWNEGLKPNQNLEIFGDALAYFKECQDELIQKVKGQLDIFEFLINSSANHRIYVAASDRTQYNVTHLQHYLRRYCKYDGQYRPNIFMIGKDSNIPINDPNTDIGIVVSGSSLTKPAINAMEVLTDEGVKTFFITHTTLEQAREQQEKEKQEGRKPRPSVWDYFVNQPNYDERVIYFPMREGSWTKEQKRASLAPEGTKFELGAGITAIALGKGFCTYHAREENNQQKETPTETVLNTIISFRDYLEKDLKEQCYNSRFEMAEFIQDLFEIRHKKIVGFGVSEINRDSFTTRLTHCGHVGKGEVNEKEGKSVQIIKSAYPGFVSKHDMVIGISKSGDNPYTGFLLAEAFGIPEKIYLITCHSNPPIDTYTKKITLPPVISTDENEIQKNDFGHLGIYVFLDSCIAQLAKNLHMDEPDLTRLHSRFG